MNEYESTLTSFTEKDLIGIKNDFRSFVATLPLCKSQHIVFDLADRVTRLLQKQFVVLSKNETKFEIYKEKIINIIDSKNIDKLSPSIMETLATAELLFDTYANESYSSKGFDYSCISSLYYQAFEDAYNQLIWKQYAEFLKNLDIDGEQFVKILKDPNDLRFSCYLPANSFARRNYIESNKKIKDECMIGSFGYLIKEVKKGTELTGFCDFFARIVGFKDRNDMFDDDVYLEKCADFAKNILDSKDFRNNASHGGSMVDLERCKEDKKIVLSDLGELREQRIGLIKQLLDLYR